LKRKLKAVLRSTDQRLTSFIVQLTATTKDIGFQKVNVNSYLHPIQERQGKEPYLYILLVQTYLQNKKNQIPGPLMSITKMVCALTSRIIKWKTLAYIFQEKMMR
jgi:hypothetical protein